MPNDWQQCHCCVAPWPSGEGPFLWKGVLAEAPNPELVRGANDKPQVETGELQGSLTLSLSL